MRCNYDTHTNNNPSLLAPKIDEALSKRSKVPEETVKRIYNVIHTERFKRFFGDFVKAHKENNLEFKEKGITDVNGEPELFEENGYHFFKNLKGDRFYIDGKFANLSAKQVNDVTANLAYALYNEISGENLLTREDFEKFNADKNIYTILDNFLKQEFQKAKESNDREKASMLVIVANAKNDFYQNVFKFYKERGITINDDLEAVDEEDRTDPLNIKSSFESSGKDKATFNIKLMLSFIPSEKPSTIGYSFVPFDEIWGFLEPKLAGFSSTLVNGEIVDVLPKMINVMKSYESNKPWMNQLLNTLDKAPKHIQRQFKLAFDKEQSNYVSATLNKRKENFKVFDTQRISPSDKLIAKWGNNLLYSDLVVKNEISTDKVDNLVNEYNEIKEIVLKQPDEALVKFKALLGKIGIDVTEESLRNIRNTNGEKETIRNIISGKTYLFTSLRKPLFVNNKFNNPFANETLITELALAESDLNGSLTEANVTVNNKQYWEYGSPSMITDFFTRIAEGDISQLTELVVKHPNSKWVQYLLDSPEIRTRIFSSIRLDEVGDLAADPKNIKPADLLAFQINALLGSKRGQKTMHPTLTMGDKSTITFLEGLPFVEGKVEFNNGKINLSEEPVNILLGHFQDEYKRMYNTWMELKENPISEKDRVMYYHTDKRGNITNEAGQLVGNAFKSHLYSELSPYVISEELNNRLGLYGKSGKPFSKLDPKKLDNLKDYIREKLKQDIQTSVNTIKEQGIVEHVVNENKGITRSVIDKAILNKYSSFESALADYTINTIIGNYEQTNTIYGDMSYFKDLIDVNKRAQAARIDGLRLSLGETKNDHKFNASVINNAIFQSLYYEQLEKAFGDNEVVQEYKNVNRTDAQALASHKRWKFIIERLGRWNSDLDVIYKKIESGFEKVKKDQKLSKEDLISQEEFKVLTQSTQPIKGVYYGLVDGKPTYLKYSLGVLLPQMIADTELAQLAVRMDIDNVDEVITLDGVKVGAFTPSEISKDGELKGQFTLDSFELDNRNWRLQQDLPTKGIKQTAIASQIQKNILANIKLDEDYNGRLGSDLVQDIHNYISELSNEQAQEIRKILKLDSKLDIAVLNDIIIRELEDRKAGNNIIEALKKGISYEALPQHLNRIQNLIFSWVNKRTTKITTNGGGLIQMSSFGLDKLTTTEKEGIYWLTDEIERLADKGLAPPLEGKPGEVLISGGWLSKYIPNWREIPYNELMEVVDSRIFDIVGYRIPNQGMSSNDNLRVVGILPDLMGDTIVPYSEITTKTGSDFDIDKMYVMMPEFNTVPDLSWYNTALNIIDTYNLSADDMLNSIYEVDENWYINEGFIPDDKLFTVEDFNKKYSQSEYSKIVFKYMTEFHSDEMIFKNIQYAEQGSKGIKNKLIQAYIDILNDPKSYIDKMTPLDANFLKDSIERLDALRPQSEQTQLNFFDGVNQLNIKFAYMGGKAGVGQTANHVVDHPLSQLAEIMLATDYQVGHELNGLIDLSQEYTTDGKQKISQVLSAFLNAYVDIAKDNYITKGNHNTLTANVAFLLARAGVPIDQINGFLMQPILVDYVKETNKQESKVYEKQYVNGKLIKPIDKVLAKYGANDKLFKELEPISNFSTESFEKALKFEFSNEATITLEESKEYQLQILKTFLKLQDASKALRDSVVASKVDTNGAGNDLATLIASKKLFGKVVTEGLVENFLAKFDNTFMGAYYRNSIDLIDEITKELFQNIYRQSEFMDIIALQTDNSLTNHKLLRDIIKDTYSIFYSQIPVLRETDIKSLFTDLPQQIYKLRGTNEFIDNLEFNFGEYSFIGVNQLRADSEYFNDMMYQGWKELMQTHPDLADKLVKHAFYSTGFQNAIMSLVPYIPHEWMYESGFIRQIEESNNINLLDNALDVYYKQKIADNKIIPKLADRIKKRPVVNTEGKNFNIKDVFSIDSENYRIDSLDKAKIYYPYLKTGSKNKFNLYKWVGNDNQENGVYVRVNPLGIQQPGGLKINEYTPESIFNTEQLDFVLPKMNSPKLPVAKRIKDKTLDEWLNKDETSENRLTQSEGTPEELNELKNLVIEDISELKNSSELLKELESINTFSALNEFIKKYCN
jgi:hypothetical protein